MCVCVYVYVYIYLFIYFNKVFKHFIWSTWLRSKSALSIDFFVEKSIPECIATVLAVGKCWYA